MDLECDNYCDPQSVKLEKGLPNLVSGYSDNGLNYSLFDWSTTLCIAKWKDFNSTFAPGAVSRCNEQ